MFHFSRPGLTPSLQVWNKAHLFSPVSCYECSYMLTCHWIALDHLTIINEQYKIYIFQLIWLKACYTFSYKLLWGVS